LERGTLVTVAVVWKALPENGGGPLSTGTVDKKKKDGNCKRLVGLYTEENKREMRPGEF
jgi:hypothetical protein